MLLWPDGFASGFTASLPLSWTESPEWELSTRRNGGAGEVHGAAGGTPDRPVAPDTRPQIARLALSTFVLRPPDAPGVPQTARRSLTLLRPRRPLSVDAVPQTARSMLMIDIAVLSWVMLGLVAAWFGTAVQARAAGMLR